jgi:hypothetical protein
MIFRLIIMMLLTLFTLKPAFSDITFEGANNEIVILTGDIEAEEFDEMLAEIKAKKPTQMILDSEGGNGHSARRLAKYVNDNNISTYISGVAKCRSACAIIFLAGKKRLCEGVLGIHQASLPIDIGNEEVNMNYALKYIQEDIGNLIELLNEFNTPSFVYPYMLKTTDMYNFSKEEIAQINTVKSLDEM